MQARQRQGSAEQALAAAQQRVQQLSSRGIALTPSTGVIDTRTPGKPKTFTGQPAVWTTWQFTFKAFACVTHARTRDVFELATRKSSDPVINSDMTVELQSLSTQLHYMLVMIMCIDAPESTTNSLSSGFNVDAGRHLFSGDEKNAAFSCSFNLNTLLASFHAASRAPCSCHSVSSCERSSNFDALGLRS